MLRHHRANHHAFGASLRLAVLASFAIAIGCSSEPQPAKLPPGVIVESGDCPDICAALTRVGCPEGDKTSGGHTCVEFCALAKSVVKLDGNCLSKASSAEQVRACGIRCRQ